jgi:signal peptidase I
MDNRMDKQLNDDTDPSPERPAWVAEAVNETSEKSDPSKAEVPLHRPTLARRIGEEFVAWVKTFASAAVYASLIVTFGFQVARVEGKSMEPTLQDQDRLIVNKAVYQFFDEPQPMDIVMLYYPRDPDKSFVKRIIAKEGDTVRIENGQVFVNEVPLPDSFVPPEFRSHENHGPEVVQESYYFVMGDHRNNSSDSRHWGQVPQKYVIGKVQLRWWPLADATLF